MASLQSNEIWELVEPPPNRRIIGSKCIFKRKVDADGEVERYKARLVAQGCTQRFGLDYEETFSPVFRFESIRSAIALGAEHKLQLHQMDISTALLQTGLAMLETENQPLGTCSFWEVLLSAGKAANRPVWLYPLPRQSMLLWPLHPKKPFGFSNSWETC